ncbi:MAG: prepilin-type N-terminal cleavage/methylation domain-containing protein [Deltaproteobacteria bacterium]|nr:prepilin-type N-terminal cleavage/methylation domain-containing protein [Deltaproteobacteria bacterium]
MVKFLRNSKGFNLIELMVVVLIVGILAAVSIPLYIGYIQKSRVKSLVYPGLHIIETNIGLYYAMNGILPDSSLLPSMMRDADTDYFNVSLSGGALVITIDSSEPDSKLSKFDGMDLILTPVTAGLKVSSWELSGELAEQLGIATN